MKKPMLTTEKLRRQAEDKIATLRQRDLLRYLPQYEEKRLVHELQVHQIELEMQNEQMRDIQTQLEESRGRYKELYDFAPVGYVTLDKFGLIHEANLTAGTLLNVSRAALIGRQIQSFMDRESADALHIFFRKPLMPGVKEILDCRLCPAEGTVLDISLNVSGEFDPSDRLVGYRVILMDVSRLKMMERQARETGQNRHELMIANSRDVVLFMRCNDGRILEANAAAATAYGHSREELLALTIHDLRAADTKGLTADQLAQASDRGILFETVHRRKDGTTFPVEVSSQGVTIDGTRALISVIRDISERRGTEAQILSLARYPEENPNPVLRVSDEGALRYANQPARAMMETMGWREGLPLPESFLTPIRDVLKEGRDREIELTCRQGNTWSLTLLPNVGESHVTLYARDITPQKQAERTLRKSEERVREKLDIILSPGGDIGKLKLADIIDARALQELMVHHYEVAHFPAAIIDIQGKVLVGVGWQDICTRFHRVHPDACKHCIESDTQLSAGIPPGEFRLYKCKNNMWDIATPIMVGGQHVGNVFSGQFFFEDETLDYEIFRSQAREYGFDEEEYIAALETVPRVSKKSLNACMAFFAELADMISQLSYSNIKLAKTMAEREALTGSLSESEERFRQLADAMPQLMWTATPDGRVDYFNRRLREFRCIRQLTPVIHPEDLPRTLTAWQRGIQSGRAYEIEHRLQRADGSFRWYLTRAVPILDDAGGVIEWLGTSTDVDDRKQAEQVMQRSRDDLEEKVRERTTELLLLMEDLEKSRDDLRNLASELVVAEERERKRIGVTLHDGIAQTLAAARMRIDLLRRVDVDDEHREALDQAKELLSGSIRDTRALMMDLSNPVLYDMGLRAAVEDLAEPIKDRHGIQVKCSFEGNLSSLSQDLNVMVFQVVRELLQNVIKHSGAQGANIRIIEDKNSIKTIVADDGEGFTARDNPSPDFMEGGFGLFSIRERVQSYSGSIRIKSRPGIGSEVTVVLPKTAAGKTASRKAKKKRS
ncbi:MAG TPA: PocR ligand-binding domain-containing protein [Syntrophales bacterium]|nr:PocR ligand-binding domain-containing protein [Syntrophales bacterium]